LLGLARERGEDFQLVLTRYANERLLYRLAQSPHVPRFVLKGAALFTVWTGALHRATRDLDLLGFEDNVRSVFAEVIALAAPLAAARASGPFALRWLERGPWR
jgi:hypothetical protein